jgi:hypothetical protein
MKLEKKLIACSLLALIIGISSVLPLMFLMSTTAKAETSSKPWFSIDMQYAYVMTMDGPLSVYAPSMDEMEFVSEQHLIALNITLNVDPTDYPADARIEYYGIDVSSDKRQIGTIYWFVGTKRSNNFTTENFHFMRDEWFDTDWYTEWSNTDFSGDDEDAGLEIEGWTVTVDSGSWRGGGLIRNNWTEGLSIVWPDRGHKSGTLGNSLTSQIVSAMREAETLYLSMHRIGWITFTGNSTEVMLANNEPVSQIQLEKFADGFLYNNLVPEEDLSTIDLLHPVSFEELNH